MKILMPVLHYHPVIGGLETWTQNVAERLALRPGSGQAQFFVVTGKVRSQKIDELKNGVRIIRASLYSLRDLSYSSPFYILTSLPFIFFASLRLIKKERIELLHCQGFLSSLLGYLLFKITNIPYIITVQRLEENKGFLRKLVYKNAKVCIAASSAIADYFREIGCKDIEVIPNGIDLKRFENLEPKTHDSFVVVTVARLEKVKGIEYLLKAASIINTKYKMPTVHTQQNTKYLIIGDGSERKNLEALTERLGVADRVKFLGGVPNERIPEYLAGADCLVLPSIKEGFGIVLLEAMAAKVPVIGTNVGGIKDIIEDGKTGILVEPKDPEAIAKAILKIYNDINFKNQLATNAIAQITSYDWNNIVERVYQIYHKIL